MEDVDNPHTYPQAKPSSGPGDPLRDLRCAGMGTCKAYRCTTDTNDVLCREHTKRLRNGGGLPTAAETFPGDPSGHGTYGQLEQTEHGAICHECGHPFVYIAIHAYRTHQLSADDYRHRHGIPRHIPLVADQTNRAADDPRPRRRPLPCRRCGTTYTVKGRLCENCKQSQPPPRTKTTRTPRPHHRRTSRPPGSARHRRPP